VVLDRAKDFFKALGGGVLLKDRFITGFLLNSRAIANYKRAKATGLEQNFRGEGEIKGGLFIVGRGGRGIAYQFVERNFGDWAPMAEVLDVCSRMQVFIFFQISFIMITFASSIEQDMEKKNSKDYDCLST